MKKITIVVLIVLGIGGILVTRYAYPKAKVAECQKIPLTNTETIEAVRDPFNPNEPPEGQTFYKHSADEKVWTETNFDVDQDGKPERILTANTAMNHTPHILRIVKDDFVVFKYDGAGVYAVPAEDNDGFILIQTVDWNKNLKRQTRYDHDAGKFIPIWYQDSCEK
jgi:hypothetical protein